MTDRTRRQWSLRRRLVVAIVALLAVVGVIVGTVSVLALRQNLIARLDGQLAGVVTALAAPGGAIPNVGETTQDGFRLTGTVVLVSSPDGETQGAYLASDRQIERLTEAQQARLARVEPGGGAETIVLGRLGAFRVEAVDNPGGGRYVAGLSMADVNATTWNLALIFALVTLATVVAAALIAAFIVRFALRPLGRVAATATRVAELPLATGAVHPRRTGSGGGHRHRHRGRSGRRRAQPHARPRRGGAAGPAGERAEGAPVRRRREPRAAHAARRPSGATPS